jgi:uncharacterized protein (DUF305 family)
VRTRTAVLLLSLVLLVSTGTATPAPDTAAGNAADVMFLQMMVPHHEQGLTLVRLAATRAARPEVRMLAAAIASTQVTEAATMSGWLRRWGQPATGPAHAHAAHGGMPGTSAEELAALAGTAGTGFERAFLNLLIAHQDDAVQLARMELATGADPGVRDLAGRIATSRSAQISQLLGYAGQLPPG